MQHTLIAVFDNRGDAQNAMNDLLLAGFARKEIRLSEGDPGGQSATSAAAARDDGDGSITSSIKHFFSDLFGTRGHAHAQKYSDAISRGHYVLTVNAADEPEVERAADIVERHGPVDIDERAAQWGGGAAPGRDPARAGAQQQSQGLSQQHSTQGMQSSAQGSQQGSAMQDSQQRAEGEVQRGGVRVYSRTVAQVDEGIGLREELVNVEWRPEDDTYFRSHWDSNYAGSGTSYDEYAPAYRYGASMAQSDQYRGRPWNDAETNLKSDWEARNPGSAWEKFKAAIRHGWERITS